MATTLTTIDVSEWQDPETVDWDSLINQGLKSVVIRLSHGLNADKKAAAFIKKAQSLDLIVHGYHYFENTTGEVSFSVRNAQQLGLPNGAHFFLDMEGNIPGDWQTILYGFAPEWLRAGWKPGLYCSDSPYKARFDNNKLVADKIARWIAAYDYEPANYDIRQYSSSNGKLDLDYDKSGLLEVPYDKAKYKPDSKDSSSETFPPISPGTPTGDSWVGWGKDSRYGGGKTLGYSPNGKDFYAVFWPGGLVIRPKDAEQIWELLKDKIKRAGVDVSNLTIPWDKVTNKPNIPDVSNLAKLTDVHTVEATAESAVSKAEKAQSTAEANSKALADKANKSEIPNLSGYALKSDLPIVPTDLVHTSDMNQVKADVSQAKQEAEKAATLANNASLKFDTSKYYTYKAPNAYTNGITLEWAYSSNIGLDEFKDNGSTISGFCMLTTKIAVVGSLTYARQKAEVVSGSYPYTFERNGLSSGWSPWHQITAF